MKTGWLVIMVAVMFGCKQEGVTLEEARRLCPDFRQDVADYVGGLVERVDTVVTFYGAIRINVAFDRKMEMSFPSLPVEVRPGDVIGIYYTIQNPDSAHQPGPGGRDWPADSVEVCYPPSRYRPLYRKEETPDANSRPVVSFYFSFSF